MKVMYIANVYKERERSNGQTSQLLKETIRLQNVNLLEVDQIKTKSTEMEITL